LKFLLSIPVGMVAVLFGIRWVIRGMRNARWMRQGAERFDTFGEHIVEKS